MSIDRNTDQCWSQGIHFGFFLFSLLVPTLSEKSGVFYLFFFNYFFKSKTLLDSYCFVWTD